MRFTEENKTKNIIPACKVRGLTLMYLSLACFEIEPEWLCKRVFACDMHLLLFYHQI